MSDIFPRSLAERRDVYLLDVRHAEELAPPFGYIPGARHLPAPLLREQPEVLLRAFPDRPPLAMYCMTGRRSAALLEAVRAQGFGEVYSLSGGLLGWVSAGLPVTGDREPSPVEASVSVESYEQALKSCFVAAAIESDLDNMSLSMDFKPTETLEAVLGEARLDAADEREVLLTALNRLGELAWRRGHPLDRIAGNMDHMRALLASLAV